MESLHPAINWAPLDSLYRLGLALTLGLFVGLEREWRGKEAGLRTFGFASLLGCMGGMMGQNFSLLCIALQGLLITFLNLQSLRAGQGVELTTSAALLVTGTGGVLCGLGQTIAPAAIAVLSAGLLAWKERLAVFSHKLTAQELRGGILLAILTFVIYPVLPSAPIDPWGLISPRGAWATVILIAAIGFVNYLLWKTFGKKGIELTGFLGGLVNSTVAVTELAVRMKEVGEPIADVTYRGVLLATAAMATRNAILLGLLASKALGASLIPLVIMLGVCGALIQVSHYFSRRQEETGDAPTLPLTSPFSLWSALKFGMIFLILQVISTLAQSGLGPVGFLAVNIAGGIVSSASAVASSAALVVAGKIPPHVAGVGAVLASLSSACINVVLVARYSRNKRLTQRLVKAIALVIVLSMTGAFLQSSLDFTIK